MNDHTHPDGTSNVPWPTSERRPGLPETSTLQGGEKAVSAVPDLLSHAVQGAHDGLDRFADKAAPVARRLGDTVSAAEDALHARTTRLREKRDEWSEGMRSTVRNNPLACVAAALALGAVIARITR